MRLRAPQHQPLPFLQYPLRSTALNTQLALPTFLFLQQQPECCGRAKRDSLGRPSVTQKHCCSRRDRACMRTACGGLPTSLGMEELGAILQRFAQPEWWSRRREEGSARHCKTAASERDSWARELGNSSHSHKDQDAGDQDRKKTLSVRRSNPARSRPRYWRKRRAISRVRGTAPVCMGSAAPVACVPTAGRAGHDPGVRWTFNAYSAVVLREEYATKF